MHFRWCRVNVEVAACHNAAPWSPQVLGFMFVDSRSAVQLALSPTGIFVIAPHAWVLAALGLRTVVPNWSAHALFFHHSATPGRLKLRLFQHVDAGHAIEPAFCKPCVLGVASSALVLAAAALPTILAVVGTLKAFPRLVLGLF
jgi:hypothetical protein